MFQALVLHGGAQAQPQAQPGWRFYLSAHCCGGLRYEGANPLPPVHRGKRGFQLDAFIDIESLDVCEGEASPRNID